jgi:hypothetical protein
MEYLVRTEIHVNARHWSQHIGFVADRSVGGSDESSRPMPDSLYFLKRADLFSNVC